MDKVFELIFWLIVLSIWLFSSVAKKKRTQPGSPGPVPEKKSSTLEERILESLGLEIPREPEPQPQISLEKKKITPGRLAEEKLKLEGSGLPSDKPEGNGLASFGQSHKQSHKPKAKIMPPAPALEIKAKPGEYLTLDKLEEGIILSVILGPPKAYEFRRGVGIGIRSGLKNRWP